MIACPLCEHPQLHGDACEVCGRPLEVPPEVSRVLPLEGLEPTRHAAATDLAGPRLEELEPTLLEPDDAPTHLPETEPLLDLEPTRAAPVEVEISPMLDVEQTSTAAPGDGPTPPPAFTTCRYCRTPALPGERRCGRCGMRLPVVTASRTEGDAAAAKAARLCSCGAPVTRAICPACGGRIPGSLDG